MATTNFSSVSEFIISECRPVSVSHTKVHSKLVKQVSTLLNGLEVAEATKEWCKVMNDLRLVNALIYAFNLFLKMTV